MSSFLRNCLLLTAALAGLGWLLQTQLNYRFIHPQYYSLLLFFGLLTVWSYEFVKRGGEKQPESLHVYFLGVIVIRLFISIGVVLAYLLLHSADGLRFVLNFMVLYFLYTGFEIYGILRNLRPFSKNP